MLSEVKGERVLACFNINDFTYCFVELFVARHCLHRDFIIIVCFVTILSLILFEFCAASMIVCRFSSLLCLLIFLASFIVLYFNLRHYLSLL